MPLAILGPGRSWTTVGIGGILAAVSDPWQRWQTEYAVPFGEPATAVLAQIQALAADAEQVDGLLRDLMGFLEGSVSALSELRTFAADPQALDIFCAVARCSRFGYTLILRGSRRFWSIVQDQSYRAIYERDLLLRELRSEVERLARPEHRHAALLRFHQQHLLRIMIGDLLEVVPFEATVREISDLAEVVVQMAYELAVAHLRPRYGTAESGFAVLALGKLGGRELNYSSDLDFIFLAEGPGATSGGREVCDHDTYHDRLGKELIRLLEEPQPEGRLFRIDMRLRPDGVSGALVVTLREAIDYYYTCGRPWERQALIKARPIAGDRELGQRLLDELRPWIFPREQSLAQCESARVMRQRIEERSDTDDLKTGSGGIRDIEFLVQSLQLVYGGRYPELRHRSTLVTLRALADLALLTREEAAALEAHYIWLRGIEHRLQMWQARQVHAVPPSRAERLHLARRCGCTGSDPLADFERHLAACRRTVRDLADRYYLRTTARQDALAALCTGPEPAEDLIDRLLRPVGFADPRRAVRILRDLAVEPFFALSRHRTEKSFLVLLPTVLEALGGAPNPDRTLQEFARIVRAVGGRAWFYDELAARPDTLRSLLTLAGWATVLVQHFERFPGLVDDMIEHLDQPCTWNDDDWRSARGLVAGAQHAEQATNLAYLQARETVQIAWSDLHGEAPTMICQRLSALARAVVALALEVAAAPLDAQLGHPCDADGQPLAMAVLGFGKLGGEEMSYASDLDVMLVCQTDGRCPQSGHDAEVYWRRLITGTARLLTDARCYEVDFRLRPWGEQGPMVVTLPMLERYWAEPRDLWERMAMLRCAVVAGDAALGRAACTLVHTAALSQALPKDAATQAQTMRARLETSVGGQDHLKRGPGGYVDCEFIAQYCALSGDPERLPAGLDTATALVRLHELGRISAEARDQLLKSLRLLRRIEARMRLAVGRAVSSIPTDPVGRLTIARQSGFADIAEMDEALYFAREHARHWFDVLIR